MAQKSSKPTQESLCAFCTVLRGLYVAGIFESLACVAGAWKKWAKERTGAREGDTRVSFSRARFFYAYYFQAPATQAIESSLSLLRDFSRCI